MKKENHPSLLWARLSVLVLTFVFLSGISEIVCLAAYVEKTNYSVFAQTAKLFARPTHTLGQVTETTTTMLSQTPDNTDDDHDLISDLSSGM